MSSRCYYSLCPYCKKYTEISDIDTLKQYSDLKHITCTSCNNQYYFANSLYEMSPQRFVHTSLPQALESLAKMPNYESLHVVKEKTETNIGEKIEAPLKLNQLSEITINNKSQQAVYEAKKINKKLGLHKEKNSFSIFFKACLIFALSVLLIEQFKFYYLDRLSQNETVRPALELLCQFAMCKVPLRYNLQELEIVDTHISHHTEKLGAITIKVTLVNHSDFEQTTPSLEVTLTDRSARIVGRRVLKPELFLIDSKQPNIKSKSSRIFYINLANPHQDTVGYSVKIYGK